MWEGPEGHPCLPEAGNGIWREGSETIARVKSETGQRQSQDINEKFISACVISPNSKTSLLQRFPRPASPTPPSPRSTFLSLNLLNLASTLFQRADYSVAL